MLLSSAHSGISLFTFICRLLIWILVTEASVSIFIAVVFSITVEIINEYAFGGIIDECEWCLCIRCFLFM